MEFAFELPCAIPDLSPLDRAIVGLDPAALVDVDAGGRTIRMATVLTRDELLSCLREAGLPADSSRLHQLPSVCCGGCSG
ncbi:MAG TPA: hypothetical protein VFI26_03230 [Lysobacter sp.]|nr:hypothetical protein [Lysobacter sp.]